MTARALGGKINRPARRRRPFLVILEADPPLESSDVSRSFLSAVFTYGGKDSRGSCTPRVQKFPERRKFANPLVVAGTGEAPAGGKEVYGSE